MHTIKKISEVIDGKILFNNEIDINNFSINSNDIKDNTLFIPIIGEKHNGNDFILDAVKKGAIGCLISENYEDKEDIVSYCIEHEISIIEVGDTLSSLQSLAHYNRQINCNTKVIAITGSNGKTSAKDLIYDLLKYDYKVLKTEGNLNNHIGLPLTLLKLNNHDICIVEMGMNHENEIKLLSNIAEPDIAIILNIGTAHIGNLGSIENILNAKMEVTHGLKQNGILFLNNQDEMLNTVSLNNNYTIFRYGIGNNIIEHDNNLIIDNHKINIKKVGESTSTLILAYNIGKLFKINLKKFKKYLYLHKKPKMRMEITKINKNIIINDSYNANYDSMKYGINYIIKNYSQKKYRVLLYLGDMLELGEWSKYYHEKLGELINDLNIDILYVSGNEIRYIVNKIDKNKIKVNKIKINNNEDDIADKIINVLNKKNKYNVVYFKGSRKIGLDKICNSLIIKLINRS